MSHIETSYSSRSSRKGKLAYSSSFKGINKSQRGQTDGHFNRENELRHSTGSIKGKKMDFNAENKVTSEEHVDSVPSVHSLIKGFQSRIGNGSTRSQKTTNGNSDAGSDYKTPGYVAESPALERTKRTSTRRKLSIRHKKANKMTADDARYSILQSLGMSPFASNINRGVEKSFAFFDTQSLFFDVVNAATLKLLWEEGSSYTKKLTGASAASVRSNSTRKRAKSGEFDPQSGRFRSRAESMIDEGDNKENDLVQNCPYFRNEIADIEEQSSELSEASSKHKKDIAKLISMFNRNRSFENLRNNTYDGSKKHSRSRKEFESTEQDILLEDVSEDSSFFVWDEPNVSGKRIFDFEHIDRGALYYREYFHEKEHNNLFGIDEKLGPVAISVIREVLPKMAVLGHSTHDQNDKNANKKYQYRIIFRTCELYALRISVLENSIPSTSRHGSNRMLPLKDVLEYCFPDINLSCLRHGLTGPKVSEQLLKLDEQQLTLKYKIGLIYCKSGQKTEEEMYNNEKGGSEFLEFCSVIADKVALKGFQGYRAQLDNKNDSTGQHSLYTTFHGREVMFHVSTELPFTSHDRQQLLRKRHIGNDIVTVIFQEPGSVPFTPQMMRSHFQHVFIIVRVENPHTEYTKYQVAVSRSRDVPYFGPPIPPDKFSKNAAFREFLLSKLCNAEHAAHKSDKFTHMARRTRYEYMKDLATTQISTQNIDPPQKFAFSFSTKKKEKIHPPVHPEIWLQAGMVWSVKFDFEREGSGSSAFLSISTKAIVFIEQSTQEIILSIPCKHILGWRPTSQTLKLFYGVGKMAFFTLVEDDLNELPFIVNRLKAVTPGCETQDLTLRRNNDGQLGFHVFYEGLVAEVEPYGLAWQSGLRKGSRLLEISGHVIGTMSHERMILMLKRPGAVRIVVLPPAPDGQPRNYKAVRNLRRYSSMTSVYSMSATTLAGIGDSSSNLSSSKEYLTGSTESYNNEIVITGKVRSISVEGAIGRKESRNSTTSGASDTSSYDMPAQFRDSYFHSPRSMHNTSIDRSHQERLITSRSASDLPSVNTSKSNENSPQITQHKMMLTSPSTSVDQELGEIERQLTDTRKSIDAKFYRSLANSPNPFFRDGKSSEKKTMETHAESRQEDDEVFSQKAKAKKSNVASVFTRRASDMHYPIVNEKVHMVLGKENSQPDEGKGTSYDVQKRQQNIDLNVNARAKKNNRNSLEAAFENPRELPAENDAPGYAIVDTVQEKVKTPAPVKPPRRFLTRNEHVSSENDPRLQKMKVQQCDSNESHRRTDSMELQESFSDCSLRSKSQEALNSGKENDPNRKGSLVRTKVLNAHDIMHERVKQNNSPASLRREVMKQSNSIENVTSSPTHSSRKPHHASNLENGRRSASPQFSPKGNKRGNALIKAVDAAAKSKIQTAEGHSNAVPVPIRKLEDRRGNHSTVLGRSPDDKLDDSLTETFAKLDAAFGFKPGTTTPPREERRRKRRSNRRRSRNFEPPSSDSSSDNNEVKRRGSRNSRKLVGEDISPRLPKSEDISPRLPKSEAEESLEAAISEFQMELSTMPEKNGVRGAAVAESGFKPKPTVNNPQGSEESSLPFRKISSHAHQTARTESNPPKVPVRTCRPQILIDHQRIKQQKSVENHHTASPKQSRITSESSYDPSNSAQRARMRSEAKVSLTAIRPWSPPPSTVKTSSNIKETVKVGHPERPLKKSDSQQSENTETHAPSKKSFERNHASKSERSKPDDLCLDENRKLSHGEHEVEVEIQEVVTEVVEDQLSPLPCVPISPTRGGIHSLPGRSNKRRRATLSEQANQSCSTTCIPLVVRGLDLAANKGSTTSPWSKEDLHVMLTVMENELEQEREEKERLSQELTRSMEEKERLLEQSKQAASQLRKFTSLFLDSSPQEKQKVKQKQNDAR